MTYKPCLLCIAVGSLWLLLSLGLTLDYLAGIEYQLLVALLMGTSIMGIAGQGERRLPWAMLHQQLWKLLVLIIGVPLAYLAITTLSLTVIAAEFVVLLLIGHVLFSHPPIVSDSLASNPKAGDPRYQELMKKLEHCCD